MMKKLYVVGMVFLMGGMTVQAQQDPISKVLEQIGQNNKEIQALQQRTQASKLEVRDRNSLEDPSVEYSPFYTRGITGMSSSELVVTQGFDFPTLYAARHRSGKLQQQVLDWQQMAARRDILLQAQNLCLDLILLNQQQVLLAERKKNADELLVLFEKRLAEGDAGVLDVNKIRMEHMSVQTEVSQNVSAHRAALQQLLAMNGNLPLEFSAVDYPKQETPVDFNTLYDEVMAADASLQAAGVAREAAEKELAVNRQNWLPKLEVGYRRNTSLDEKSNGFLVGGSLPLFSNRRKVRIARAQADGARLELDNTRLQAEAQIHSQYNELCQLREAMQAYDVPLMHETLSLLRKAVDAGQLSVIDYYTEADNVYRNLQAYMQLENQYQKLLAAIYKYRL